MTTWHPRSYEQQTKWTAPSAGSLAHNFHPDAALQWGRKPFPSPQDSGPPHQFRQQWRPPKMGIPCLSQPKEPSLSSLAGTLLLLDSWRSPGISQHFPAWCLQPQTLIARKIFFALEVPQILVVTMSQHRHVLVTNSAIKMTRFCCNIRGLSHKESPNITRPKFSSFCTFFWNVTAAGADVNCSHWHLCKWCRPTEEEHGMASFLLAPIVSKHHLILWTASVRERIGKKILSGVWAINFAALQTTQRKQNSLCWCKKSNTNSSQCGQEFVLIPQHRQNDTDWLAGDLSHWWAWKQDRRKSSLKQINGTDEPPWDATMKIFNSTAEYHCQKPPPVVFDYGRDTKSLLRLTHFVQEVQNDERFCPFSISLVSLLQLLLKCPPLQIQLLGLPLDLKKNRE